MQITSNKRLLSLARDMLTNTLAPEIKSSNGQATAQIVQQVFEDLIKRETVTPSMLRDCVDEGLQLVSEIRDFLSSHGYADEVPQASETASASHFSDLVNQHAQITRELSELASGLRAVRSELSDAEAQNAVSDFLLRAVNWELRYPGEQQQLDANSDAEEKQSGVEIAPLTRETLQAFLERVHPDGHAISIQSFEFVPGGFGKQTSIFTLADANGKQQRLIARKNDPFPMLSRGTFVIENECELLRAVNAAGYTVAPKPLWLGKGVAGVDADFFIMECLPGKVPGSFLGGLDEGNVEDMLLDVADKLAQLHALKLEAFEDYIRRYEDASLLTATIGDWYRRDIEQWRQYAQADNAVASPYLSFILDWLERHVPDDKRAPVLVHGDYNIHNMLVENQKITGLLDWECAMFGAPEQDLAYIQPHIAEHIDWQKFVDRYRAGGGPEPDPGVMPFCMAFSTLRLHIAMQHAMYNLQNGINEDGRYAMVELGFGARFMQLGLASTQKVKE